MDDELLTKYLEETGGTSDYFRAIEPSQIQLARLTDIHQRLREGSVSLVTSHYGTLANAVSGDPAPPAQIMTEGVRIVHKGLVKLHEEISRNDVSQFAPQELVDIRRSLAVMTYLVSRCLSGLETKSVQQRLGVVGKGKKQINLDGGDNQRHNWRDLRSNIMEDLLRILKLPVEKIWDDSGYGYSVPRLLIRSMCSNFCEPSIAEEAVKQGSEAAHIFAILAKRFEKKADIFQRLFPLMKYGEEVGRLISQTVGAMVEDGVSNAVSNVLLAAVASLNETGRPASTEKGVATVVLEMCENNPKEVVVEGCVTYRSLLGIDSPVVRSAAVQGCGHLLHWSRRESRHEGSNRKYRSVLLNGILIAHCKDVNILVRAKALQVLTKLVDDMILDPVEVSFCFAAAIDRLSDIGATSRKYALTLVKSVLSKFPGICKVDMNYQAEIDAQRRKLLEMMARKAPSKSFMLASITREFIDQVQIQEFPLPEEFQADVDEGMDKVRPLLTRLLGEEKYWDACVVFYHALNTYSREVGIGDAANLAAANRPTIYLDYFKLVQENNGHDNSETSLLDQSLNLSMSMSQEPRSDLQESDEVATERKLLQFAQGSLQMKLKLELLIEKLLCLLQISKEKEVERDRAEVVDAIKMMVGCGYPLSAKISTPLIQTIAMLAKGSAASLSKSFWNIFIGEEGIGNMDIVANLFKTLESVDAATRDLLKPIIAEMHTSRSISMTAVNIVWTAFTRSSERWTRNDAKNAVFVIGAISKNERKILTANFKLLLDHGLSETAVEDDLELVRYTLEAILHALRTVKKGESDVLTTERLPVTHLLWDRIIWILEYGVSKKGNWDTHQQFPRIAEIAVQIIYRLSWDFTPLIKRLLSTITTIALRNNSNDDLPLSEIAGSEELYIRYLAIMTSILGAHIYYCETIVIPEIKRRKGSGNGLDGERPDTSKSGNASVLSTVSRGRTGSNVSGISNISALSKSCKRGGRRPSRNSDVSGISVASNTVSEMEACIGTAGFDAEIEIVKAYVEKLLDSGTFLQFRRLTLFFCQKITSIQHYKLQLAIVNAMTKLMLVSAESVHKLVEPFIGLWKMLKDTRVKVEILKHLTVLNVRFPNQIEKCNVVIKDGLLGEDIHVKTACLDFMGYLALGDIVKIRDNIADVALCLCSDKAVIRELAKDFFQVCADRKDKENVISNSVPDVISQLSNRNDVTPEQFQTIMKYLLTRVKKEKQVVGLVETLISRLKGPKRSGRIWEDTAHCLTLLPHNDKTFKIFRDNLNNYADKLEFEPVYDSFQTIIDALRKSIQKQETKALLEDYSRDIDEHRDKFAENQRIAEAKARHQNKRRRRSDSGDQSSLMEDGDGEAKEEDGDGEEKEKEEEKDQTMSDADGKEQEEEREQAMGGADDDSNAENRDPAPAHVSKTTKNGKMVKAKNKISVREKVSSGSGSDQETDDDDDDVEEQENNSSRTRNRSKRQPKLRERNHSDSGSNEEGEESSNDDDSEEEEVVEDTQERRSSGRGRKSQPEPSNSAESESDSSSSEPDLLEDSD